MTHAVNARFAHWMFGPLVTGIAILIAVLAVHTASAIALYAAPAAPRALAAPALATTTPASATSACTTSQCKFDLFVNPGLAAGKPFACPAIQDAKATITISNRFVTGAQNDEMTLKARGLPANTGFDVFLVQNSAFDAGFRGNFGFGWYQSDLQSDDEGAAVVRMRGIFDRETFIENPADPFNPIHTYNVGFWFNSPADQAKVCGSATPAATPFNGEQNAGLLAMITRDAPLQLVQQP
ncbi:MAG TPA: hypothetical protein VGR57_03095 [Ktedonobacterales bacterium]|nr:hypothetical protein [Ktedonobacterales bacterium]